MQSNTLIPGNNSDNWLTYVHYSQTVFIFISFQHFIMFACVRPHLHSQYANTHNSREGALVMYIFTSDSQVQDLIVTSTQSGSVCINDTVMQYAGKTID